MGHCGSAKSKKHDCTDVIFPCPDDPLARDDCPLLGRVSRPRGSGVPARAEQGGRGGGDGGQDRLQHRHARHRLQVTRYFQRGANIFPWLVVNVSAAWCRCGRTWSASVGAPWPATRAAARTTAMTRIRARAAATTRARPRRARARGARGRRARAAARVTGPRGGCAPPATCMTQ